MPPFSFSQLPAARASCAATIAIAVALAVSTLPAQTTELDVLLPLPASDAPGVGQQVYLTQLEATIGSAPTGASDHPPDATLAERLAELEDKYSTLEIKYQKLSESNSDSASQLKRAVFPGNDGAVMELTGRIHIDYWAFPGDSPGVNAFESDDPTISPQDRFGFRRLRFGVQGDLPDNMLYRIDMEFAGGNDVEFRDAFFGWTDLPLLHTLQVGNQKRPYALDHLNSSRNNVFLERPFIVEGDDQDSRRLGIQSLGHSDDLDWNWQYGVFNQRLIQDEGAYVSDHYQLELAGRLASTFWYDEASDGRGYGHFALAGVTADPDGLPAPGRAENEARFRTRPEARTDSRWLDTGVIAGTTDYQLLAVENIWNLGALQITSEYQNVWLHRETGSNLHFHGGYVYFAYFLTGEHMTWNRQIGQLDRVMPFENFFLVHTCRDGIRGGWGAWQIAYRWSYADFTNDDVLGGIGESHTLGLNWLWNAYARMQFNASYGEIHDHAPVAAQTFGTYTTLGTRFMVDF